jgi:hypothetical protein
VLVFLLLEEELVELVYLVIFFTGTVELVGSTVLFLGVITLSVIC